MVIFNPNSIFHPNNFIGPGDDDYGRRKFDVKLAQKTIDLITEFEIQCPYCKQKYKILGKDINKSPVTCKNEKCKKTYIQHLHKTSNDEFIRNIIIDYKGTKV